MCNLCKHPDDSGCIEILSLINHLTMQVMQLKMKHLTRTMTGVT